MRVGGEHMRARTMYRIGGLVVGAALALGASAETVTYKGSGHYTASRVLLPLVDGGAAFHAENDTIATIAPSEPGFIFGECAGLGYVSSDGVFEVDSYCTWSESAEDGFVTRGVYLGKMGQADAGGRLEVIGGTGKWEGAHGQGSLRRRYVSESGDRGSYDYEITITTP